MAKELLMVFIGGGLGSCLRYLFAKWLAGTTPLLPMGTLMANLVSCFILGFLAYAFESQFKAHNLYRILLMVGFCGGFSTFSTFSSEILSMLKSGNLTQGTLYVALSLIVGVFAVAGGAITGQAIIK